MYRFLCPRCRKLMPGLSCECGFSVPVVDGIYDFLAHDPASESLRDEILFWDTEVYSYDTHKPKARIDTVSSYFRGEGEHHSAAHMLPALAEMDLRGKFCLEVGGVGHCIAMMLKSGCTHLVHLEVSKESQRGAMRNLALLPETAGADICWLSAMAERIPLPDNTVDFLMAFGTYHHTDRRRAVPEIYRVLKPGGMFYFTEAWIGTVLQPLKWITRAIRKPLGFNPGNDNPLGRADLAILKRNFPEHRFEIRYVLDAPAFLVRYLIPPLGKRMYQIEVDVPGVTTVAVDFLKGVLLFSGRKST